MGAIYNSSIRNSPYAFANEKAVYRGYKYVAQANAANIFDESIDENLALIQGCRIWAKAPNIGDYIEFSIVDKDDVLGLFSQQNIIKDQAVLEVERWTHNIYLPPWNCEKDLFTKTAIETTQGLYLRACYINTGGVAVDFAVEYMGYEK